MKLVEREKLLEENCFSQKRKGMAIIFYKEIVVRVVARHSISLLYQTHQVSHY